MIMFYSVLYMSVIYTLSLSVVYITL